MYIRVRGEGGGGRGGGGGCEAWDKQESTIQLSFLLSFLVSAFVPRIVRQWYKPSTGCFACRYSRWTGSLYPLVPDSVFCGLRERVRQKKRHEMKPRKKREQECKYVPGRRCRRCTRGCLRLSGLWSGIERRRCTCARPCTSLRCWWSRS